MHNYQNNNKFFACINLVEDAIRLITSQEVQYLSIKNEKYIVCKNLKILIVDDGCIIDDGYKRVKAHDLKQLLMPVLVEVTELDGLSEFKDRCLKLNQLHDIEKEQISKISSLLSYRTPEELYEKILFSKGTALEAGKSLNISKQFIKNIRRKNRKAVIRSILCEILSDSCKEKAA